LNRVIPSLACACIIHGKSYFVVASYRTDCRKWFVFYSSNDFPYHLNKPQCHTYRCYGSLTQYRRAQIVRGIVENICRAQRTHACLLFTVWKFTRTFSDWSAVTSGRRLPAIHDLITVDVILWRRRSRWKRTVSRAREVKSWFLLLISHVHYYARLISDFH
jgi:hypothetical protein